MVTRKIKYTKAKQIKECIKITMQGSTDYGELSKTLDKKDVQCHTFRSISERNVKVEFERVPIRIRKDKIREDFKKKR